MNAEQQAHLERDGFILLPARLDAAQIAALNQRVQELADQEGADAGKENYHEPGVQRLANLANKGGLFLQILTDREVLSFVRAIIGPRVRLNMFNSRALPPHSSSRQPLHADTDHGGIPDAEGYYVCTAIWMLDHFTQTNGATHLVPGTHRLNRVPKEVLADVYATHPDEIVVEGKAGDVLIFNGHVWHAGGENTTDSPRRALLVHYIRADHAPRLNYAEAISNEVQERLDSVARGKSWDWMTSMRAVILERRVVPGLQSASGVERVGDYYFVVGDDCPELFRLDAACNLTGTTRLFASDTPVGGRISKESKPDLEAMCVTDWNGRRELLCFGSGSKTPSRDVCYRVDVTNPAAPQNVRAVPLTSLYNTLRANHAVVGTQKLNLEAAAVRGDTLLLFQRGNISGVNSMMEFDLRAFMEYLDAPGTAVPTPHILTFTLPRLHQRHSGFSAASTLDNSILFSASVEDTDNEIDDGATLGSFIGRIDGNELQWTAVVEQNGAVAPVKIEGISVLQARENYFEILAVTDNDEGASEVLRIEIS